VPILRKGDRAVHFAHVPRTGGRALLQAIVRSGWSPCLTPTGSNRDVKPHLFHDEIHEQVKSIPSFAVIRDPIDRFISATKYNGRCHSQSDLIDFIHTHKHLPEVEERHFAPQISFLAPHTVTYRYESQYQSLIDALRIGGIINLDVEVEHFNHGAVLFEVNKDEINQHLSKIRRWYIDDYRQLGLLGKKADV